MRHIISKELRRMENETPRAKAKENFKRPAYQNIDVAQYLQKKYMEKKEDD